MQLAKENRVAISAQPNGAKAHGGGAEPGGAGGQHMYYLKRKVKNAH